MISLRGELQYIPIPEIQYKSIPFQLFPWLSLLQSIAWRTMGL